MPRGVPVQYRCQGPCGLMKTASGFYQYSGRPREVVCRDCRKVARVRRRVRPGASHVERFTWPRAFIAALLRTKDAKAQYDPALTPDVIANLWIAQDGRCAITNARMRLPPAHKLDSLHSWLRTVPLTLFATTCIPALVRPDYDVAPGNVMLVTALAYVLYRKHASITDVRDALKSVGGASGTPPVVPSRETLIRMPAPPESFDHPVTIS